MNNNYTKFSFLLLWCLWCSIFIENVYCQYHYGGIPFLIGSIDFGTTPVYPTTREFGNGFLVSYHTTVQRYSNKGTKIGGAKSCGLYCSIGILKNGGFVNVWVVGAFSDYNVNFHVYDSNGGSIGSGRANTLDTGRQQVSRESVCGLEGENSLLYSEFLKGGGFVIVWEDATNDRDGDQNSVYGQIFNDLGVKVGGEFQINTYYTSFQYNAHVTCLKNGGFVVVYVSYNNGYRLYGQYLNSSGVKVGSEFEVSNDVETYNDDISICTINEGDVIVTWEQNYYLYARRYDDEGNQKGGRFTVSSGSSSNPWVTFLKDGGFLFVFRKSEALIAKRFDAMGNLVDQEFRYDQNEGDNYQYPSAAGFQNGNFVTTWRIIGDVKEFWGRIYNSSLFFVPVLEIFEFTINEGQTIIVDSTMLKATDYDSNDGDLEFTIMENNGHCYFSHEDNPTVSILSFIQQEVVNGKILLTHDGGEEPPSFKIRVYDGKDVDDEQAVIHFLNLNDPPIIEVNNFVVSEGSTLTLTNEMLKATDVESEDSQLLFFVHNLEHGYFYKFGSSSTSIFNFTQNEVDENSITFVHDGGEIEPYFEISVSDGESESITIVASIYFVNDKNDPPTLIKNCLVIEIGEVVTIDEEILNATDSDGNDMDILYRVDDLQNGHFSKKGEDSIISTFTQLEIRNGDITFKHSGENSPPFYKVQVSDGVDSSLWYPVNVTFSNIVGTVNQIVDVVWITLLSVFLVCCFCLVLIFSIILFIVLYSRKKNKYIKQREKEIELLESSLSVSNFLERYKIEPEKIEILKLIGSGASASVYLSKWGNNLTALKLFKSVCAEDIQSFELEAKIMLESNHPKIIHLFGICIKNGCFGLDVGTLKDLLKDKSQKLSWKSKWNISYDIASGLEFLHNKNIYHRDMKTDNILICKEGELHAKIADFGLSKHQDIKDRSVTMAIGTYKYLAPEMVIGVSGQIGMINMEKVDIYALGMVFVALITEKEPYPDKRNEMCIPSLVGRGELYQKLDEKNCPKMFLDLTNQCRKITPEKRPSAFKIVEQLERMKDKL